MGDLKLKIKWMICHCFYLDKKPEELGDQENLTLLTSVDPDGIFYTIADDLNYDFNIACVRADFTDEQLQSAQGIFEFAQTRLQWLETERPLIIKAITQAFDGVERGKITLHETEVIDDYGGEEERAEARKKDRENTWQGVPDKDMEYSYWWYAYVDAQSLKYYLPAYMIWTLKHHDQTTGSMSPETTISAVTVNRKEFEEQKLKILNEEQCKAVARFLEYMSRLQPYAKGANRALEKYWRRYLSVEIEPKSKGKRREK